MAELLGPVLDIDALREPVKRLIQPPVRRLLAVRDRLDPTRTFANAYTGQVFGA
ncbi:MAG TPA: hypothetical protein VFB74_11705 [Kribbellaceae bacterium]|nr:hypothetical protein [Kribbellaceae bacterium]